MSLQQCQIRNKNGKACKRFAQYNYVWWVCCKQHLRMMKRLDSEDIKKCPYCGNKI